MSISYWLSRKFDALAVGTKVLSLFTFLIPAANDRSVKSFKNPPIFIVGVPRSGTTYLYQLITNELEVSFIDNTTHLFHSRLRFGMWLSRKLNGSRKHKTFKSKHGKTWMYSMHAPSECTPYWKHFLTAITKDSEGTGRSKVNEIEQISDQYQSPMVIKNLSLSLALENILKLIPNARFVHVERDLESVAKSMLRVRKSLGVPEHEWWSIKPSNYDELKSLPEMERVKLQAESIDREIRAAIAKIPQEQVVHINYPLEVSESELVHKLAAQFRLNNRKN